jgi:hypothetical protein
MTVHASGVNWETVAAIVTILAVIIGIFSRWIAGQITAAIQKFNIEVVTVLRDRLTAVEVKLDNLRIRQVRDDK